MALALDRIVRSAVDLADDITKSLQPTVAHSAWVGMDVHGTPTYAAPINRECIVEYKIRDKLQSSTGRVIQSQALITIIGPVAANGAAGRVEPIDPRDKIVLPNGQTGPIIDVEGVVDPDTDLPYMYQVWIGGQGPQLT